MNIKDEAKKLYDAVLKAYEDNPNMLMSEILNDYLKKYNDKVAEEINKEISSLMNTLSAGIVAPEFLPYTKPKLSSSLYKNAKDAARTTYNVMQEHIKNQSTINEIREVLYDGYGYDELLKIKKKLPRYLSQNVTEERINRLKTAPLRNAYLKILNAKNDREFQKALRVALEEKARYYALRIARTEEQKAFTLAEAFRNMEDGVEFVKWTMSSAHKTVCICEFFAYQNVG